MSFHFVKTRVEIASAAATWPPADALLLPTNDYLWMASGPALEIKKLAGPDIETAAVRQGPIQPGEVVLTDGGGLPVGTIIHAAVMGQDLHADPDAAAQAVRKALEVAAAKRWKNLLVHSFLAAGRRSGPDIVSAAAKAMVETLLDGSPLLGIVFLAMDNAERSILHESLLRTIQNQG